MEAAQQDFKKLCTWLYGIYAGSIFMQFSMEAAAVGSIAIIIALIIAYRKRKISGGGIYESHFHWLIRTFWVGGSVYLPIITVAAAVAAYFMVDMSVLAQSMDYGASEEELKALFMKENGGVLTIITLSSMGPFIAWWLSRCWRGYKFLKNGQPVPNVMSWL